MTPHPASVHARPASAADAHLTPEQLLHALTLRDLTDPDQGEHAMQQLLAAVTDAVRPAGEGTVRTVRTPPIVPVRDNYDRLGYAPDDVTRARRYTRYVSPTTMLRSHTSAQLPAVLEEYRGREGTGVDDLIVVPGLVYRRDAVDRSHVGEPHQVDLWRLRDRPDTTDAEMLSMIDAVVDTVLPGAQRRLTPAAHPYTRGGRQVDVLLDGQWLEIAECGRIHPAVLEGSGLDPRRWSGLALGMGLDRALMLRKQIPDIRLLRARDARIADQMRDLAPWRPVSSQPPARRDLSVVLPCGEDEETLGDRVRTALGDDAELLESVSILSRTPADRLPAAARDRLGILPGQENVLIRIVLRPYDCTLWAAEANALRNRVYRALHEGPVLELI
ncbi:PheS-related mystery ligase SrmL [Brachybacterium hainanense]|uniref:Phenylalanyl-tRNA synthetase n=1 Tax=Brachybacterium hainanense TaxID=1541174 RepID=A0ABV6R6Y8_9MICO